MITTGPYRSGSHKEAHVQGWLVSILLHGTMALAAILFVKQVQLAPQDEAFKWNVAMVSPLQIGSTNDIIPEPGPVSIHSTADLDSLTSHAAACVGTDASSAPAVFATDDSFDF